MEAGHRPLVTEFKGSEDFFQDRDSPVCSLGAERGLDGVSRLEGFDMQVPIHPESRKFLRLVAFGKVHQFKLLCFGLSMASQVFTRFMAPVSAFIHRSGIRLRRYLNDWLIQAASGSRFSLLWTQFSVFVIRWGLLSIGRSLS